MTSVTASHRIHCQLFQRVEGIFREAESEIRKNSRWKGKPVGVVGDIRLLEKGIIIFLEDS
jgi:hypothetical protein